MKNFLFDLYGTLIDIRTDEQSETFWEEVARLLGGETSAQAVRLSYYNLCADAQTRIPSGGEFDLLPVFEALLQEYPASPYHGDAAGFARAFRVASMRKFCLFEGVKELLSGLKERGAKLYLLSNAQACFTRKELEEAGISAYFDGILLSSEAGVKKPDPAFFRAAFKAFGLSPEACVYVGNDLRDDVGGARGVGMRSVYIETEQSGIYPSPPAPDFYAKDRDELAQILFSL